jgi:hypothetical protein
MESRVVKVAQQKQNKIKTVLQYAGCNVLLHYQAWSKCQVTWILLLADGQTEMTKLKGEF